MAFELQNRRSSSASYQQLDDDAENGHPLPPKPQPNLFQRWLWESLAALVALGSMAAIIVILDSMDGKPEDRWTFYFKLSSTVAGFITVVKSLSLLIVGASLSQRKWSHFEERPSRLGDFDVFDEASRGPMGAIRLLWHLRIRWSYAALGAIITIATVSVDSLAQQVIDTRNSDDLNDSNRNETTFWVAESYITGAGDRSHIGSRFNPQPSTVDAPMQGAIYRGIYGIESSAPFDCPSQCRWEGSYKTLGIESKCEDVTLRAFAKPEIIPSSKSTNDSGVVLLHTPGGLTLTYNVSMTSWLTAINLVAQPTYSTSPLTMWDTPFEPDFARIGIFRLTGTGREQSRLHNGISISQLNASQAEVYECQLGFRAFEYSDIRASGNKITIGSTVVHTLSPGVIEKEKPTIAFRTPGLPTFRVSTFDIGALGIFLNSSSFTGSVYDGESAPLDQEGSRGLGWTLLDADIHRRFANTALSMTHQLQSGNLSHVAAMPGKNVVVVAYVVVRWEFLVVPVVVVGAAVLFLGITMWATRRDTLWKSSAVAVLYHDLEQPQGASEAVLRPGVRDEKDLNSLAGEIQVRYER